MSISHLSVHTLYCHILTSFLASLRFDVVTSKIILLSEFNMLGVRNLFWVGLHIYSNRIMSWRWGNQSHPKSALAEDEEMHDFDIANIPDLLKFSHLQPLLPGRREWPILRSQSPIFDRLSWVLKTRTVADPTSLDNGDV